MVIAILLGSGMAYEGLHATAIWWGGSLGSTDDDISRRFEDYGTRDASFQLANQVLGNGRSQSCGDLCRIMREYTNVRDSQIHAEVRLVDSLAPTQGERPNIFMCVIDAMRPDYLGVYNPQQVNYTPNLDALARDSVVFKNVYTQYAGTSLSEPALWAGAMLLHAHYPEPFEKVDSLATLTRTDQYRMVASTDEMLNQVLPPSRDLTLLDTDKERWNQLEICSTVEQTEHFLDGYKSDQPVLLYTQPKNVHQFARNDVPSPASQHWQSVAGLNSRITYEVHWVDGCLGGFFNYLKRRGMYDNSVIIVTSDHGDATGELGRISHSTSIWPEIMRVPLIVHLPAQMSSRVVYDTNRLATLTDIVPSLYYLLGHKPIQQNPLYGRPLFAETRKELESYPKKDIFLASDVRAVYGILTADGRYLYTTYDSPAQSYLFDLMADPNALHDILTPPLKQHYDEEIIEHLQMIGDFYGYKPGMGSLLAAQR
jgi:membrane-anchored protein YejM (alkaline phosphatase superfamily)